MVIAPEAARQLCINSIEKYYGKNAIERFEEKKQVIRDQLETFREDSGINHSIEDAIAIIDTQT